MNTGGKNNFRLRPCMSDSMVHSVCVLHGMGSVQTDKKPGLNPWFNPGGEKLCDPAGSKMMRYSAILIGISSIFWST